MSLPNMLCVGEAPEITDAVNGMNCFVDLFGASSAVFRTLLY
jgi:hypothetical protein